MGGYAKRTYVAGQDINYIAGSATHSVLIDHPNFKLPEIPEDLTPDNVIEFTLDAVAEYLSPEKLVGESNSFACEDIKSVLKNEFKEFLLDKLNEKTKI